ncbi:MAG: hypothetical protein IPN93_17925 [Bacteroidetes bacterium]|nr:hypothetical protein [Bacteroidota bacterium]
MQKIIFCKDYEIIAKALESQTNTFTWGKNSNADIRIIKSEKTGRKTSLIVEYQQKSQTISVPFSDEASIENALHCVATMLLLDYNFTQINERLALLKNVPMTRIKVWHKRLCYN